MSSVFDSAIRKAVPDILSQFGVDCWVNGVAYPAIFNENEFRDETSYQHEVSIEIESSNYIFFRDADNVVVQDREYKIRHVQKPSTDDPFILIELKRA